MSGAAAPDGRLKLTSKMRVRGLAAVRPQVPGESDVNPDYGTDLTKDSKSLLGAKAADEWESFSRRGWRLIRPSRALLKALAHPPGLRDVEHFGHVYVDAEGHLFLSSGLVTVRLTDPIPGPELDRHLASLDVQHDYAFRSVPGAHLVAHVPTADPFEVVAGLRKDLPACQDACPEFLTPAITSARPSDPNYASDQWFWRNTGQAVYGVPGLPGADVSAERAWDATAGRGSVIAIIDDGFEPAHEDLYAGVSPESGYYVNTHAGLRLVRDKVNPTPDGDSIHGTLVAGMAAARANNDKGGCGLAFESRMRLIALRGLHSPAVFARAIEYAIDPRSEARDAVLQPDPPGAADVISISLVPPAGASLSRLVLRKALRLATREGRGGKGAFICWAATNSPGSIDGNYVFRNRRVSVVAMTDHKDEVRHQEGSGLPNQGYGHRLQFVAPGISVWNAVWPQGYNYGTGCSYATPVVAGLAALVYAVAPRLRWFEVCQVIRDGCEKIESWSYNERGFNQYCGYGRVNAPETLRAVVHRFGGELS